VEGCCRARPGVGEAAHCQSGCRRGETADHYNIPCAGSSPRHRARSLRRLVTSEGARGSRRQRVHRSGSGLRRHDVEGTSVCSCPEADDQEPMLPRRPPNGSRLRGKELGGVEPGVRAPGGSRPVAELLGRLLRPRLPSQLHRRRFAAARWGRVLVSFPAMATLSPLGRIRRVNSTPTRCWDVSGGGTDHGALPSPTTAMAPVFGSSRSPARNAPRVPRTFVLGRNSGLFCLQGGRRLFFRQSPSCAPRR
jgi:hypothetical protein